MGKKFFVFLALFMCYPLSLWAAHTTKEQPVTIEKKSDFKIVVIKAGAYRPYAEGEKLNSELDELIAEAYGVVFSDAAEISSRAGTKFGLIFFCESRISSLVIGEITISYDPPLKNPETGNIRKKDHEKFISRSGELKFYSLTVLKQERETTYFVKAEIRCWDQSAMRIFTIIPAKTEKKP